MSPEALDPAEMLEFTGDLGQLERDVTALTGDGASIWESGAKVDSSFQGLSSYYEAPEAERLFAITAPVATGANEFCDELETVSQALGAYANEVRPLVDKLNRLTVEAADFRTRIASDDEWHYDDKLTEENNSRRSEMLATWDAFQNAERTCSNKVFALFSDFRYVQDDGKGDKPAANEYGYSADMLENAQGMPWGDAVEESVHWYEMHRQIKRFVWDGFIVDGVWGTIRGLGTLVGTDGGPAAGQAWTNLAKVVTGIVVIIQPASALLPLAVGGDKAAKWMAESQTALKEAGKAMISYDQWGKHNARAAGGATFNVLSTILTGGVGAGLKGGAIARGLSAAAKVVNVVDPMTYVAKGARFGALKIGDAMATLRNLNSGTYLDIANGSYKIADVPVKAAELPPNSALRPENSVRMTDPDGKVVYLNTETRLLHNADGTVIERPGAVKPEMSAEQRGAEQQAARPRGERELAGVGGRAGEAGARTGDRTTTGHEGSGGRGSGPMPRPGGSGSGGLDNMGRTGDDSLGDAGQSADGAGRAGDDATTPTNQADEGTANGRNRGERELTPAERKQIQDEHVRKANAPDKTWYKEHYDKIRRRLRSTEVVDGAELPVLALDRHGNLVAKYDLPSGPSEVRLNPTVLGRDTVALDELSHLDQSSINRIRSMELTDAEKAFKDKPSAATQADVDAAQEAYARELGDRPNNSKIAEELGEDAARYHVIPHKFEGAEWVELPKTPNGANTFDQVWKLDDDGGFVIVEAKAPSGSLAWRKGLGEANGMMVKQGTREYALTIVQEMLLRGGKDAEIAGDLIRALDDGKLKYVLVQASKNTGMYAGATLEHFKIH